MSIGLRAVAVLCAVLTCGVASADVVVRVQVLEGPARPEDAAPDVPAQAELLVSIETLPQPGGAFRSRTEVGGRIVELKGNVTPQDDGFCRVSVTFSSKTPGGGGQEVSTNLLVTTGKPTVIGKLVGGGSERSVLLTVVEDEVQADDSAPE